MAGTAFSGLFDRAFYTGGTQTTLAPYKYDVAIAGRGYMLDRKWYDSIYESRALVSTIRATRAQSDGSTEPGEQSLNPDDLWRRSQQSWHLGAGQNYLDREDSDRRRFRQSKGLDWSTQGQLSLLNATAQSLAAANTNLNLMPAGSRLYSPAGTALKYTTDLTSWSTTTGTSGASITGIASDGFNVWVTDGSDIYKTDTGTTAAAAWSTTDADILGYVKGRLMYAKGPLIGYASNMATPTLTALFTHASTAFTWVGFAEGPGNIYAAGYSGDKSLIYRIAITKEATSLDAPVVAGELPDGEIIYSIGSYLGFIFLGTSTGARFCTLDGQGNLTIGSLLVTPSPVRSFEGQGEFVWFGWTNYDATSTGLGRISLRNFVDSASLQPAYGSDLMVTAQANVLSVCTFLGKRVFAVSGNGVYKEDTANLVTTGTIDCGRIRYNISEKKIPLYLDVAFKATFAGQVDSYIATNGSSTFTIVGTHTTSSADTITDVYPLNQTPVDQVEVRHTFTRSAGDTSTGPTIVWHTVRAQPVPNLRRKITLAIELYEDVTTAHGRVVLDPAFELEILEDLRSSKQVVPVQVGVKSYSAMVDDFDFIPRSPMRNRAFWNGTALVTLKTA